MLKNILSITGKSGLFKLVSRGNNMLIVESLQDGKRMPTYARDKIVSLADVSMFTTGDDIPLWEVLEKVKKHEMDYTPQEKAKIGRLEGECAGYMARGAKDNVSDRLRGIFNEIRGILDGINDVFK